MNQIGSYMILNREEAKRLFAAENDAAVRDAVAELLRKKTRDDDGMFLTCGALWDPIHRCLTDGTLDPQGGEFPLNHCVLGGRHLYQGDEFEAILVRPDIVPHVAEALHRVKRVELQESYSQLTPADYGRETSEKEFDAVWSILLQIRQLFEDAADNRDSILFTVARES